MINTRILISACLIGQTVRYDGNSQLIKNPILNQWLKARILIPLCPEVSGGLTVPRLPAEIYTHSNDTMSVNNKNGNDVTNEFELGANITLQLCLSKKIKMAILTESSPSCGSQNIYDGHFSSTKINGQGITTKLLRENNIKVFNQYQLDDAFRYYEVLNVIDNKIRTESKLK